MSTELLQLIIARVIHLCCHAHPYYQSQIWLACANNARIYRFYVTGAQSQMNRVQRGSSFRNCPIVLMDAVGMLNDRHGMEC